MSIRKVVYWKATGKWFVQTLNEKGSALGKPESFDIETEAFAEVDTRRDNLTDEGFEVVTTELGRAP